MYFGYTYLCIPPHILHTWLKISWLYHWQLETSSMKWWLSIPTALQWWKAKNMTPDSWNHISNNRCRENKRPWLFKDFQTYCVLAMFGIFGSCINYVRVQKWGKGYRLESCIGLVNLISSESNTTHGSSQVWLTILFFVVSQVDFNCFEFGSVSSWDLSRVSRIRSDMIFQKILEYFFRWKIYIFDY